MGVVRCFEEEKKEDRISQLPDGILHHIISLISIRQAVEMSLLSRRWKNLWLSLSNLNFNFNYKTVDRLPANLQHWKSIKDFIEHFLSHRDHTSTIRKFNLELYTRYAGEYISEEFVEKCTDYAINHGVTDLSLDTSVFPVSAAFFACKTLRKLKLKWFANAIDLPKWSMPHLNTLHLEDSRNFSKEPFFGFPELEELTLKYCTINGIVIFCPKLRNLEISSCSGNEIVITCRKLRNLQILDRLGVEEISTPELTSFRFTGNRRHLQCSKANNFPMLEEAYFNIKLDHHRINDKENTWKCMRLLHQFGNAKIVTLSLHIIKAIETNGGDYITRNPSSPFPNIRCLKLMKGVHPKIPTTVFRRVINYLTGTTESLYGDSVTVELPEGVSVVNTNFLDMFDQGSEELQIERLFQIED